MRILLTGASSFTGFWFARSLAQSGHDVVAVLSSPEGAESYSGVRGERVRLLAGVCRIAFAAPFGSEAFLSLLQRERPFDRLCHHWAEVRGYRSPDFDVVAALAANTRNLAAVLEGMRESGCGALLLTGSVFEPGEGIGNPPLRAFSPYGLSKGLTREVVAYSCERAGMRLDRFVIPNPFGPYEEPRFTDYLMRRWFAGETAEVATPRYVRDNIPVDLLAKAYAAFATAAEPGGRRLGPSLHAETQGAFAERVARAVRARMSLPCALRLAEQRAFPEPEIRINTDFPDAAAPGWSEEAFWDSFVRYYEALYARR
jgi:UDP-glucose 4-epimerase